MFGFNDISIDKKSRFSFPAKYRDAFINSNESQIVITKDPQYPALMIYPGKSWKEISRKFEALGGLNQKVRPIQWKVLGNASVTDFEVSERMLLLIPQLLRDFAGLKAKKKVALIGMGSKLELWNLENWKNYIEKEKIQRS